MSALTAFITKINVRHWARHRLRTVMTVMGVTMGVTLVVAIAVINSTLLSTINDTAQGLAGSADIEVAAPDSTGLPVETIQDIASVDGVAQTVPVLRSYATLEGAQGSSRALVLGLTPNFYLLVPEAMGDGGVQISGDHDPTKGIYLSEETAVSLGVEIGDALTIQTPTEPLRIGVAGFFSGELVDALEAGDMAVMALPAAQAAFHREGRVDSVYVVAEPGTDHAALQSEIEEVVTAGAVVGPPGDRAQGFEEALNGIATLTSLAGTVALFVSAFVVFNTMSMSIVERRREISLTLAIGASRRQVIAGFVGEAAVLGLVASLVGIAAGCFLASLFVQPGLDGLRVFSITAVAGATLEMPHIVLGLIAGVGVSIVAAYLPARRIMKVAPVEALRPQSYSMLTSATSAGKRRKIGGVVGVFLIGAAVMVSILTSGNLNQAVWTTNLGLVLLLTGSTLLLPLAVPQALRMLRWALPKNARISSRLAVDSLMRDSGRTTLTVGALVFTLGIVVAIGGTLDSYRSEWVRSATNWYGAPINVAAPSYISLGSDQLLPVETAEVIENAEGVRAAYPARYRVINIDGRQTALYIAPYLEEREAEGIGGSGEFRSDVADVLARGEVVISKLASIKKDLDVGDELVVPTPTGDVSFVIGGVVDDLNPLDSMFINPEMFLEHWQESGVDRFEVTAESGYSQSAVMGNITESLENEGIAARVTTKDQLIMDTLAPIDQLFSVARAIQLAALVVAALAIANTMFITVLERRWELGLQRAVGMDGRSLRRTLLSEAGVIGIVGSLGAWIVGLGSGYLMLADMRRSYAFSFPYEIPIDLMALTLLVGSIIAIAAGAYPSRSAQRTPIVEALRFE